MKISVITRHAVTNYGSFLQAFATQKVLNDLGYECEIIDYIRDDESYKNLEKTLVLGKQRWASSPIRKLIYLIIRQPGCWLSGRKFEKERFKYLNLTKRYSSREQLEADPPAADVYLTGSDQVWGPTANGSFDSTYCLSFVEGRKCSYASSFGRTKLDEELCSYFKFWLSKYDSILVREESAVNILKNLGFNSTQVLDPTLLLDCNYWEKLEKPIKAENYILVYQLHNNKTLNNYAMKMSRELKLPVVRISVSLHQIIRGGRFVWCPNIGQFLSYIHKAKLLITDSFHGTAFAIIFNTQFIEILPNNNTGTRNLSILNLTGLSDRVKCTDNELDVHKMIDFSSVNSIIERERAVSISLLRKIIEGYNV